MQMCFIMGGTGRVPTPQGSIAEVPKDETPLATQQRSQSDPIPRSVYHNGSHHLANPKGSDAGKCKYEFQLDNSLELRAMNSSALLTRRTNLTDEESPGSPSFRFYLGNDSELDLNEDSNLNENEICSPILGQTLKDMFNKTDQLIDTSNPLLSNKKLGLSPGPRKKEKGWKFTFCNKKDEDSRNTAPHQPLSRETAAVILQKVIRGFLLRKHLKLLRNINAIAEDFGKMLAKYGEILVCDSWQKKIMHLLSLLNSVRVATVYKRKVLQKIMYLQKTMTSIASGTCKLDPDTIVEKSGVVVNSDELTVESFSFPKIMEPGSDDSKIMEEAPSNSTYSTRASDDSKIMENNDWDPFEEDDIVIDFYAPTTQNSNTFRIEENERVEAVNLIEEPAVDGQGTEDAKEDTMMKNINLDPMEMQKESYAMLDWNKLKQTPNFDQNDGVSSTEETPDECMRLAKTTEIEEMEEISISDKKITEKEMNSNDPAMETMDEVYDPIKCKKLLDTVQMLKHHKDFANHALEASQLEMYCNQTEEKEIKGLKELIERLKEGLKELIEGFKELIEGLEELSAASKEMDNLMKGLENSVQELEKKVQRIERKDNINMKKFGRRCHSFS